MIAAVAQAWPPFVLVAGLLLVGRVTAADGVFAAAAARVERVRGGGGALLASGLALVALTTAVLNLDTAAVFLTPVMVLAARRRGLDERPFLYGTVFMVNASSLYLPGSNLTNLLVLSGQHVSGSEFARRLLPGALAATAVTGIGIGLLYRRSLSGPGQPAREAVVREGWLGAAGAVIAAGLILVLPQPALPVLGVGVALTTVRCAQERIAWREAIEAIKLPVTLALFAAAVGLGTLARHWALPAQLVRHAGPAGSAALGAAGSVLFNNLPASVLLSSTPPAHPRALLVGLNLGPNLAVTGALSAYLWASSARAVGARPSARHFTRQGLFLAPAAITAAVAATELLSPGTL